MLTLINKITGAKGEFSFPQGDEWEEVTQSQTTAEKKDNLKRKLISARKNYLISTDWYITREIDEPNTYPQEIKNKRILAREEINNIEVCTTLTQLNQFDEVFQ